MSSVNTNTILTALPLTVINTGSTVITATVEPVTGRSNPTGTVTFTLGSYILGTATLTPQDWYSVATLSVSGVLLGTGTNTITGTYSGATGTFGISSGSCEVSLTSFQVDPPNFRRPGVIAGFAMQSQGTLTPVMARGALFAQGTLYIPATAPTPPAAPANQFSYLAYNSTSGWYWTTNEYGTTAGDAVVGWVRTNASSIIAVSNQQFAVVDSAITTNTQIITTSPVTPAAPTGTGTTGSPAAVAQVTMVSLALSFDQDFNPIISAVYTPPSDANFIGVHAYAEEPDFSGTAGGVFTAGVSIPGSAVAATGSRVDLGTYAAGSVDGSGNITVTFPPQPPVSMSQTWRIYLSAYGASYDGPVVQANQAGPTPSLTIVVTPNATYAVGEEYAPKVSNVQVGTIETRYTQTGHQYRVPITWLDPTAAQYPDRIAQFSGVQINLRALIDLVANLPIFDNPVVDFVPKGVQQYLTQWLDIPIHLDLYLVGVLSVDQQGNVNTFTAAADFETPIYDPTNGVTLLSDVTAFGINFGYGYANDGTYDAIAVPTFTPPSDLAWSYVNIIVEQPSGSGAYRLAGTASIGDSFTSDDDVIFPKAQEPMASANWDFIAVSVDNNGRPKYPVAGPFGTSPRVTVAVTPQAAATGSGVEYAPLVTGVAASIVYSISSDGTENYGFHCTWTPPTGDDRYQGIVPTVVFSSGYTVPLGRTAKDATSYSSSTWPVNGGATCTLYFLSRNADLTNSIQPGITPAVGLTINVQTSGSLNMARANPATLDTSLSTSGGTLALASGAVTIPKFASNLLPVGLVTSLPTLPSAAYPVGIYVLNTSSNTMYKNQANTWVAAINGGSDIQPGSLNLTPFASSLRPVAIVSTLPTLPDANYPQGAYAYNSTTGALSKSLGSSWQAAIYGQNDIVAGSVVAANIAANTITAGQIAAGAITATQIAAGAITATQIAANTITSGQIAAATITGSNIAANTITAANIVANTITAAQIAAGTITATQISGSYIYAGAIAASQITAGTISASITLTSPTLVITGTGSMAGITTTISAAVGFSATSGSGSSSYTTTISSTSIAINTGAGYQSVLNQGVLYLTGVRGNIYLSTVSGIGLGLYIGGVQVAGARQAGVGTLSSSATLAQAISYIQTFYSAVAAYGAIS